ncbi:MAG: class I SAM-dependent methyltransferase, partial [Candidatus Dormibacteria bacterium]
NEDSGRRWAEDPDRQDKVLAPIADVLVAAAGFTPGEAVLDVGCGCGATTLAAAELVGAPGGVLGLDLSAPMLEVARRRCHERAAANVRFEQADAQTCALPRAAFDVAISRFGTMFFDDPVAAFRNVAGALGRGGRLAIATWQPLVANAWLTVPGAALLRYGTPPATADGASGMFSQSDPSDLAATLTTAGFDAVVSNPVSVTLTLGANATEATEYLTASGPGRAVLETISEADRPTALDEVRAVLAEHAGPRGVSLDAAILLTTATLAG